MNEEIALDLSSISKSYPGIKALDNIDLKVRKGTIHGFIGPNGAGKSTTMKIIAGLIPPSEGRVLVNGKNALENPDFVASTIGILPETPPLYPNMKVEDYLRFCQKINGVDISDGETILNNMIERCGLNQVRTRLIGPLSKGYKQRVAMAQALVYGAEIIVLDEPIIGLDPTSISEMRDLIVELKKDHTILLSSHQLHEVGRVCDEITIINNGQIIKSGTLEEVQREYSTARSYEAIVSQVTESLESSLRAKEYVQGIEVADRDGEFLIKINILGDQDYRAAVTSILAQEGSLLQFNEKKMELEDVFRVVVNEDGQ